MENYQDVYPKVFPMEKKQVKLDNKFRVIFQ